MTEKKQIEEMEDIYYTAMLKARETLGSMNEGAPKWYAKAFYRAGYRKQTEGEWVRYPHNSGIYCSLCKRKRRYRDIHDAFCPNCGAKMKGGE